MVFVSSAFDSGNIEVLNAEDPGFIRLAIRKDNASDFYQWFHFDVADAKDIPLTLRIENAGKSAYPKGWEGYSACASYDRQHWFRVGTSYDGDVLTIQHMPATDHVYYAYFVPYSSERHRDLVGAMSLEPHMDVTVLGQTLDGQPLDMVRVGLPEKGKPVCWFIARQHPGETMAEWWVEGALERLSDRNDPVTATLLEKAVLYIVPNMNPDGSKRGNLRTNAAGRNLNREWREPSMKTCPEVALVRDMMDETGVDFCLDVHGDEALPYNFIAGFEGIPSATEAMLERLTTYTRLLAALSPDFQTKHGYPIAKPGQANLSMATNQIAERFGSLAMTLEMPFKDNADLPMEHTGWSPERAKYLAHDCLTTLVMMLADLR
ncbi:MAG: M14-type cytosolic carboxypeptidase [Pseudomonadota bacterium]